MLTRAIDNTSCCKLNNGDTLREVMVKIGLKRIDMQEEITVETLLDSGVTGLVMSSEFARKQGFRLKKIDKPIHIRNVNGFFNKEGPIKHTVGVNIYYQEYRERTEIDMIGDRSEVLFWGCHGSLIITQKLTGKWVKLR